MFSHHRLVCTICALHFGCSFVAGITHSHEEHTPYEPEELLKLVFSVLPPTAIDSLLSQCNSDDTIECLHTLTDSKRSDPPISQPTFNRLSSLLLCSMFEFGGDSTQNVSHSECIDTFIGQSSSSILGRFTKPQLPLSGIYESHCNDGSFNDVVFRNSLETQDEVLEFAGAVVESFYETGCWHLKPSEKSFSQYFLQQLMEPFRDSDVEGMWQEFGGDVCNEEPEHIDHCYSPESVSKAYSLSPHTMISSLTDEDLLLMCPALLYRALNPACAHGHFPHRGAEVADVDTQRLGYLYGTIAITVCSMLSLLGIPLVLFDRNSAKVQMLHQGFIGLAVSSMAGDAILHLWPQAVGLHKPHGSEVVEDVDDHGHDVHDKMFLWRSLAVLGSLYLFFVFETVMHQSIDHRHTHSLASEEAEGRRRDRHQRRLNSVDHGHEHHHHHGHDHNRTHHNHHQVQTEDRYSLTGGAHSHPPAAAAACSTRHSSSTSLSSRPPLRLSLCRDRERTYSSCLPDNYLPVDTKECAPRPETILSVNKHLSNSFTDVNHEDDKVNGNHHIPREVFEEEPKEGEEVGKRKKKFGIPEDKFALVTMLILGDMFHNLSDGLAVGAAFSNGISSGISTSIAVLCHELPHELGDFAILYDCGLTLKKILLLNFISSIASFVGLYIGVAVSASINGSYEWIFAVTAGMFLYVAFIDLLPQMMHVSSNYPWAVFLVQNIGLVAGFAAMLLLALLE